MATCQDYADGIKVKVKHDNHPKPIHVPNFIITSNSATSSGNNYDFSFEHKTLDLMTQWEQRRKLIAEKNRRLEEERQAKIKEVTETLAKMRLAAVYYPDDIDEDDDDEDGGEDEEQHVSEDDRDQFEDMNILRPEVVTGIRPQVKYQHLKMRHPADLTRLSVFDFDSDTSSPFDNMELKTLNDMELLAEVLEYDRPSAPSPPPPPPPPPVSVLQECSNFISQYDTNAPDVLPQPDGVVSDIMRELREEIDVRQRNRCEASSASVVNIPVPESPITESVILPRENTREDLGNPYYILSPALQTLCERITSMGFPLDRVARACEELGEDNKKIIEYLLMMGQIMDLGFPESKVAKALLDNNFNRDKALDQLIS